jgi:cytochrome c551/c552
MADAPGKIVAVSYEAACMGCHVPAAKTVRGFIQGYPTLTQH